MTDERVVARLREIMAPLPPDMTDDELLSMTKGSMIRASVEFNVAMADVRDATIKAWAPFVGWLARRMVWRTATMRTLLYVAWMAALAVASLGLAYWIWVESF